MKVFTFHYPGEHNTHPDEDAVAHVGRWLAVFDGVTLLHQRPYPRPSPAARAAELACKAIINSTFDENKPIKSIRQAGAAANRLIREYNNSIGIDSRTVDFLKIQYAAAVGAWGYIVNGKLYCGQLTDCEAAVLYPDGSFKFRLETNIGPVSQLLNFHRKKGDFAADSPKEAIFARSHITNNKLKFKGESINVGVFTGQPAAEEFIKTGTTDLLPDETVILYSDGSIPYVEDEPFRHFIATSSDLKDFHERQREIEALHERTILIVRGPYD